MHHRHPAAGQRGPGLCRGAWLAALLSFVATDAFAAELPYGRLTPFDPLTPLPSASARNMIFDAQGQAWFTVYSSGVGYYTGDALKLFTTEDGLSSVTVNGIGIDAEGYVWVASEKGVSVSTAPTSALYAGQPFTFITGDSKTSLPRERVLSGPLIVEGEPGVWVAMPEAIQKLRRNADGTLEVDRLSLAGAEVAGIAVVGRALWLFEEGVISRLGIDATSIRARKQEPVPCPSPRSYIEFQGHRYLGCERSGLWAQAFGSSEWKHILREGLVRQIREDGDALIWAGSDGVFRGDHRGIVTQLGSASGFEGAATDVRRSPSGGLWISGQEGIHTLPSDYATMTRFTKVKQGRVTRPLIDNRLARGSSVGGDWLWLAGADVMVADASSLETIGFFELRPSESAWVACSHPSNDAIWVGTNQRLLRIAEKPGRSRFGQHSLEWMEIDGRRFEVSATQFSRTTACLSYEFRGRTGLCFSRPASITCFDDNGETRSFDHQHGLPKAAMQGLAMDSEGRLYSGSYANGLYRSHSSIDVLMRTATPLFTDLSIGPLSLPTKNVEAISFVDDHLLLATDAGLLIYELGEVKPVHHLHADNGLGNTYVYAIAPDGKGSVWVGGNEGITRVEVRTGKILDRLAKAQGLLDQETPWHQSISSLPEGGVAFATNNTHVIYRPSELGRAQPQDLKVTIRNVSLSYSPDRTKNQLRFRFGVGPRDNLKRVWYRYRVQSSDAFSDPSTEAKGVLQNLQAFGTIRSYRLEVQASLDGVNWNSPPAKYRFDVKPPVIFTWWVMLLGALGLGALFWLGLRWRLGIIRKRADVLQKLAKDLGRANDEKARELTERKALAAELMVKSEELARTLERAQSADKLKGQILANLSHELRTPLNALINIPSLLCRDLSVQRVWKCGACGAAFEDEPEDEIPAEGEVDLSCPDCGAPGLTRNQHLMSQMDADEVVRLLERTSASGENLAKTVGDMLEYAKLESDTVALDIEDASLAALLEDLKGTHQRKAEAADVDIMCFVADDCPLVPMHRALFEILMSKLLENAIDFAPAGSLVMMSVTPDPELETLAISVRDDGIGISSDHHESIFESFQQVDGGHTRGHQGVGLGLAIAKRIADLHDWRIGVESALGEGTTFHVKIPLPQR